MSNLEPSPSLVRELAPWVVGALVVMLVVVGVLLWTAPPDNLLHRDYGIL